MNHPFDDNSPQSSHSPLDDLMQSLGLDSHQPLSSLPDVGQLHNGDRDQFNSGWDAGHPGHHSALYDSGMQNFTPST